MKRYLPLVGLSLALLLPVSAATALSMAAKANALGGSCTKLGAKAKIGTTSAVCNKVGKKLVWQKAKSPATAPSSTPTPTKSATPTPTPTPTPTVTKTPSATPSATPTQSASTSTDISAQSSYEINVNARTWVWSFVYLVEGSKELRKGTTTTLFVPQGKVVNLNLRSTDTAHGFWVPGLSLDKDVNPSSTTTISLTAKSLGKFPGSCSIDCGRDHSNMTFTVEVVSEADYLKFLATLIPSLPKP